MRSGFDNVKRRTRSLCSVGGSKSSAISVARNLWCRATSPSRPLVRADQSNQARESIRVLRGPRMLQHLGDAVCECRYPAAGRPSSRRGAADYRHCGTSEADRLTDTTCFRARSGLRQRHPTFMVRCKTRTGPICPLVRASMRRFPSPSVVSTGALSYCRDVIGIALLDASLGERASMQDRAGRL
jgi:hypothetical protein